jgi:hypothetical protein
VGQGARVRKPPGRILTLTTLRRWLCSSDTSFGANHFRSPTLLDLRATGSQGHTQSLCKVLEIRQPEQAGHRSVRIHWVSNDADFRIFDTIVSFHNTYAGAARRAAKSRQLPPPTSIPAQMWKPSKMNAANE